MRHIAIGFARRRRTDRHRGAAARVTLATRLIGKRGPNASVVDVDAARRELEALDHGLVQIIEMRYFGGYNNSEIAEARVVADRAVRRHWDKARAVMLTQRQP